MSKTIDELAAAIGRDEGGQGDGIRATGECGGVAEARVSLSRWQAAAEWLRDNAQMDHFGDITAVDHPEREPERPRFDVICMVRSSTTGERIHIRTEVEDGARIASLVSVWAGANWGEREVWDMFGIEFDAHPDLRRILMYEEFVGHPLRKDYPIDRAQPLVPYRDVPGIEKLSPFGIEEGQPWGRIQWDERLEGRDRQVSPAIAVQTGQRRVLSDSEANEQPSQPSQPIVTAEE